MKRISRSAIVGHPAKQMYELVEDIEAYPRFLPWCTAAVVHERTGRSTRATLTVGVRGLRQAFTTRNANTPGESIEMALIEGPFKSFGAAWRFRALSPEACRIEFTLEYEFASRAAGRLLEPLFDRMADTMVDAFAQRAEQVHGTAGR